jgi:hypothetical protein
MAAIEWTTRIAGHFPFIGAMRMDPQTQSGFFGLLWPLAQSGWAQPSNSASGVPQVQGISDSPGFAVLGFVRHAPMPVSSARRTRYVESFMAVGRASSGLASDRGQA